MGILIAVATKQNVFFLIHDFIKKHLSADFCSHLLQNSLFIYISTITQHQSLSYVSIISSSNYVM